MRLHHLLVETGLDLTNLRKHGGRYFDKLIDKIRRGDRHEVEPNYSDKFPSGVIIDPKVIPYLQDAFYPSGSREQAIVSPNGDVQVVNAAQLRQPVPIAGSRETIPLGALRKTQEYTAAKANSGILAEGILGAALTAKFQAKAEKIGTGDIIDIFAKMKVQQSKGSKSLIGAYDGIILHDSGAKDNLKFIMRMQKDAFDALVTSIQDRTGVSPEIQSLMSVAANYVNAEKGIADAIETITSSADGNTIEVVSDGISDAKMTKADLILRINDQTIKLISLKAMGVGQFGQVSGYKYENFKSILDDLFDVDISRYKNEFGDSKQDIDANYAVIKRIYDETLAPIVSNQLSGGADAEAAFVNRLASGIVKHATLNQDLDLVKFEPGIADGYKVLKVDNNLRDEMAKTKFKVIKSAGSPTLKIMGKTTDPDLIDELGSDDWQMLVQLRTKHEKKQNYLRHYLESGPLFDAVTKVKRASPLPTVQDKDIQRLKDLAVGRIVTPGERDVRDTDVPDVVALGRRMKPS